MTTTPNSLILKVWQKKLTITTRPIQGQQLYCLNDILNKYNPKNVQNPNVYLRTLPDYKKISFQLYVRQRKGSFVNESGARWFWRKVSEAALDFKHNMNHDYYIYAIGAKNQQVSLGIMDNLIKFGITTNINSRFNSLQKANPFPLEVIHFLNLGTNKRKVKTIENNLLSNNFSPCELYGEWVYVKVPNRNKYAKSIITNLSNLPN